MKAIIDGRRYDTEKAELVGEDSYGYSGDFRAYSEKLYRTKNGSWFLAGSGGPLTKYAVSVGQNETSGSSKIIPLSKEAAMAWLESADELDALEAHFADAIEDA